MMDAARVNSMAWMAKCFPDLAEEVRIGKTDFFDAYLAAVRRAIQNAR